MIVRPNMHSKDEVSLTCVFVTLLTYNKANFQQNPFYVNRFNIRRINFKYYNT